MFSGQFERALEPRGMVELPPAWVPEECRFCAFHAPHASPPGIAVHPAVLAEMVTANLAQAARLTATVLAMVMLDVENARLVVPAPLCAQVGIADRVLLVGKGTHFMIHRLEACANLSFLPPTAAKQ